MSIIEKLATSLNRRDEIPNKELAVKLASKKDFKAVKELVENLKHKNKGIRSDCIKTLYEIGEINPELISDYANEFIVLLESKDNRLQWGGMAAINAITLEKSKIVYASLTKIMNASDKGSVITKDNAVSILVKLCSNKNYREMAVALLLEQIMASPVNQLPTYSEKSLPFVDGKNKNQLLKILSLRLKEEITETKRKRIEKVVKQLSK